MALAAETGSEIVSVDSMQVYRGMDIGTAKPDVATRRLVPHHMIDLVDPDVDFTVADFQRAGREAMAEVVAADRGVLIAGGSGLHLRALIDPMRFPPHDATLRAHLEAMTPDALLRRLLAADPRAGDVTDLANPRRVLRAVEILALTGETPSARSATPEYRALRTYEPLNPLVIVGLDPGDDIGGRIERRFDAMLADGLLDEVARLDGSLGRTAAQAVGYKELLPVVRGSVDMRAARTAVISATRALAKRQRTFFRRDPRIRWITWHDDPAVRLARTRDVIADG